jgi:hypothetical protein
MSRAALIAGVFLFASAAAQASPVFRSPRREDTLAAGDLVEVRWEGIGTEAREVELLLSLDGGRTALRLTEQLSSGAGTYSWRVPEISSRHASLILRMGIEGREIQSEPSAEFEIVSSRSVSPARLTWIEGETWLAGDDAPGDEEPRTAPGLAAKDNRWSRPADSDDPIEAPASGAVSFSRGDRRGAPTRPAVCPTSRLELPDFPPRLLALRI